jgi:hypothetical protein
MNPKPILQMSMGPPLRHPPVGLVEEAGATMWCTGAATGGGRAPPSPRLVPPERLWRSASMKSAWRTPSLVATSPEPRQLPRRAAANFLDLDPVPERKQERN